MNANNFVIDTSTPERLERDFYAWLNRDDFDYYPASQNSLCFPLSNISDGTYRVYTESPGDQMCSTFDANVSGSPSSVDSFASSDLSSDQKDIVSRAAGQGRNQLGRTYSPGLPLSMTEREEIVKLFQTGWKICDISKKLCVTHSCVSKILNRFRQTGSVRPKDAKEGKAESPLVIAVRQYRARLGITRQSEIREQLIADGICTRENAPSRSSINHILRTKLDIKKRKRTSS